MCLSKSESFLITWIGNTRLREQGVVYSEESLEIGEAEEEMKMRGVWQYDS
tara:strand:- start:442 stop:594 length:153 start_codon:yes stop_codon:yes gene_type:complete